MEYRFNEELHCHTLDGAPLIGTSSMASVLNKPGLTYWASGLCAEKFGWCNKGNAKNGWTDKGFRLELSRKVRESIGLLDDDAYLKLLDEAYSAHTSTLKSSAKMGVDLHAECERFVRDEMSGYKLGAYNVKIMPFINWTRKNVKRFLWSETHCYSKELWLGGISDCGFEDMDGKIAVLDFKSSKDVYISQFWQCIGYAIQLEENGGFDKNGKNIFVLDKPIDYVAVLPFGMPNPEVKINYDMKGGKEAVKAMLLLYKKLN